MEISLGQLFLAGFALTGPGLLASFPELWFGLDRRRTKWTLLLVWFLLLLWGVLWLVHALSPAIAEGGRPHGDLGHVLRAWLPGTVLLPTLALLAVRLPDRSADTGESSEEG